MGAQGIMVKSSQNIVKPLLAVSSIERIRLVILTVQSKSNSTILRSKIGISLLKENPMILLSMI